jgi:glucan phosphoethanolaminetransferase (alkaline phosphatase superfamily)
MAISLNAGWVIISLFVLAIIVVVALIQKRQSMATGVVKIGAIFVVLSIGYIFIINHVQLTSMNSIIDGTKIYFNWLIAFFNKAADVTSYAIKQDWTKNTTIGR